MTAENIDEADRHEAASIEANRADMMHEIRQHEAEYSSLPIVIACAIPLLIFGSLLLTMLGLESKWWYLALFGIPALIGHFYPLILLDRLKTPLRLGNGEMVTGWKRCKVLIGFAIFAVLWMFRTELFGQFERLWNSWQGGW